ncbi:MAG: hypothetical protein UR69_C0003G0084 [Candidatus Moranbacteria bacterium GW2011_GWE2_35_2-]|nr:MAG: hypothetical protein UR69_C0003G0084 [Candidatus Moranbacteria bacterium GW2011_GWE2_35_2-]KKQ06906.1 MAG: hypothetical protein US15_C0001G0013 [Candidatus Moranbacteria bacterium GW2011_GWF1_36_4]KKQ22103.1 MAG: hypothetical protein US37_C0004G0062 [Candidatus Moranbacteria bacterium GW2011_GWF2_37_11]KKQ29145.1 MAG: hypothetical protein US44_C0003G0057 [Candidatus Moranbacteria bacterium GW2011_GWD1_37_17]KKQ31130.1 MAG: hypothetical protein US47_C0001G0363 [Candidatus Moranbacteria b
MGGGTGISIGELVDKEKSLREEQARMDEKIAEILWTNFRNLEDGGIRKYLLVSKYGNDDVSVLITCGYLYEEDGDLLLTEKGEEYVIDMHLKNK